MLGAKTCKTSWHLLFQYNLHSEFNITAYRHYLEKEKKCVEGNKILNNTPTTPPRLLDCLGGRHLARWFEII